MLKGIIVSAIAIGAVNLTKKLLNKYWEEAYLAGKDVGYYYGYLDGETEAKKELERR